MFRPIELKPGWDCCGVNAGSTTRGVIEGLHKQHQAIQKGNRFHYLASIAVKKPIAGDPNSCEPSYSNWVRSDKNGFQSSKRSSSIHQPHNARRRQHWIGFVLTK
jgi:hypothetical protein